MVFPRSTYVPTRNGKRPTVPPGTVFYIGDQLLQSTLNGNLPQTTQTEDLSNDEISGRLMWRVLPQLNMPTQPMPRTIGINRVRVVDTIATDKGSMSQRMEDLAREFDCLGYFDSDDDGPKAA